MNEQDLWIARMDDPDADPYCAACMGDLYLKEAVICIQCRAFVHDTPICRAEHLDECDKAMSDPQ